MPYDALKLVLDLTDIPADDRHYPRIRKAGIHLP